MDSAIAADASPTLTAPTDPALNSRETRAGRMTARVRSAIVASIGAAVDHYARHGNARGLMLVVEAFQTPGAVDASQLSDDVTDETRGLYGALGALGESLADLAQLGATVDAMIADESNTLDGVCAQLRFALGDFERAAGRVKGTAVAWGDLALKGPALKASCIADMTDPTKPGALSRSAAEKAVTSHPTYAAYREELDELARRKIDAETETSAARVRIDVLTEIAASLRAVFVAEQMRGPMFEAMLSAHTISPAPLRDA